METHEYVLSSLFVGLGSTIGLLIGQYFTEVSLSGGDILLYFILMTIFYSVGMYFLNIEPF